MNPIKTEEVTVRGKPVWEDPETGERYSEKTYSFDYGDGIIVLPTIDPETGQEYDIEELMSYVIENGPYDPFNGEKLPVFQSNEKADKYAQWRSDNQFNEDIYSENYWHQDAGMPYTSDESLDVYRPTFRDNLRLKIDQGLQGLGMSEGASYKVAKGVAGEQYPTDGGLGIGIADLTAMGIPMGLQEARRDYNAASDREDPTGMGMAVLDGALSLAEAAPVVGVGVKGAAKGIKKIANKVTDAYDPNSVGSFGGNLFAKGFDEPSDETLDALRSSYPNMEARDEVYRVGERRNTSGGVDVRIGPEKPLEEVPLYPSDPERKSVFIDPELARVEYDGELYNKIVPIKGTPRLDDLIEPSDDIIYRGMSAEEYRSAVDQGFIKSKGEYNVGTEQEGLTFFSSRPSQAESYANNYTPEGYKATPDRPAYVVGIKRPKKVDYVTGETEIGLKGEIPTSEIVEVYEGQPYVFKGDVGIMDDWGTTRTYGSPDVAEVTWKKIDENSPTFALGGLAEARKGITTEEGREMANKKFQLDQKEADKNGDGTLSKYEELSAEAVQKADSKYGMNCGGMMEPMIDEVSGNEIPIGSTAENVRDDIEIMISEGEYVLPADVVKWHGLKHIMEMQDEAKMGLMAMYAEGLIQYTDEEPETEEDEEAEEVLEDEDVPSEDVEVEYPAVEVEDELDDDGTEEEYPEMSVLPGMMKKSKIAFIS